MHLRWRMLFIGLLCCLWGCAVRFEERMAPMAKAIGPGRTAAVSWVYDRQSGDVTALGDTWRERIEGALRDRQVSVKARKDIGFLIDDAETFGMGIDEQRIWQQAGTDVLICGNYALRTARSDAHQTAEIDLTVKALRIADSAVLQTFSWREPLPRGWAGDAAAVKGNVFQDRVETIVDSSPANHGPTLSARLDRSPACYAGGAPATLHIETDPGCHVYILNLAADRSVTLLYPNPRLKDQPLPSGRLAFPPTALRDELTLLLYPLRAGQMSHESFKVVASRLPIDFSFLPVPENAIYAGAKGGDIKQVVRVLRQACGWSETVLDYWVGPDCR